MRLFRHGAVGSERAGALDRNGVRRDLSLLVPDITPEWLSPDKLGALAAIDLEKLPVVSDGARLGAPVAGIRQFIAIGLNYRKHAAEAGMQIPNDPVVFNKAITCIHGPNDDLRWPQGSEKMDWEVELAFVVGTKAQSVGREAALGHIAGYCLANDVSEREWQANRSGQWVKGKSFDTFGPLGPWLVTADEIPDPQAIPLTLSVNGAVRQKSGTNDMIFTVAEILSHLSQFMTLLPGDVVVTGTPEGVGAGMKPPQFLKRGDVIELDGGILGSQRQTVV
ncbi:2-keto-4-pentenoate hydratase/2-oxohepta-3-ene-1,7-dioic acid hydratase in catechol pathway [Roseiarcus fermentans]|uniref:2-keto-4-pentenoate hydratase/2-oxohepta-3-ene-1,7-dioic acid hydratase in catechol pathway n=1 Tax=Roseiarcus fermentans TaxID=1473586 RepID=A0A366EN40_9HYPH|nr:fumarylacetoacetate hydrolase family protein [Roseiarcus fermentans]RBP02875.1 2-keto-4-pentenoate hydratase/2-oxohepta-3-ene-1,7-dioic acid hydratase in catechol pathway [Roseiarcus fermentans]